MRPATRERTMPLVPEPFQTHIVSKHLWYTRRQISLSMTKTNGFFYPTWDIQQHLQTLDKKRLEETCSRAERLQKKSIDNEYYQSSESLWETIALSTVFSPVLDDESLRMDKRPYEFIECSKGKQALKYRIPDWTMGLKSYEDFFLERGFICNNEDCTDNHEKQQPDKRLSDTRLREMMENPKCGLIVDGVWGQTNLMFPFAIYEAKKDVSSMTTAVRQLSHACKTYLAMLDDLARDPDDISRYQERTSEKYQLFAFASCGSYWQAFTAWNDKGECMIERIWDGDVKVPDNAMSLICIMNQVHDYATDQHRPFVMRHLEAWHSKHERTKGATSLKHLSTSCLRLGDIDIMDCDTDCNFNRVAKWKRIKKRLQDDKIDKAYETRVRNHKQRGIKKVLKRKLTK
ncbi:hypothetical protein FGADI_11018 [Fusarium gaditjirri]|uniref:Uncharacterized protein n=1 Tax=Fusarium gaditjirri TaxID=282569 RepID=A0A8H4WQZ2_9HYPO|nr:hypothetical protein FGADI_11018 [Fusarium gaditjirri]